MREEDDIGAGVMVGAGGGARLSREGYEGQQPGVAVDALSQRCRWASADREDERSCTRTLCCPTPWPTATSRWRIGGSRWICVISIRPRMRDARDQINSRTSSMTRQKVSRSRRLGVVSPSLDSDRDAEISRARALILRMQSTIYD